MQYYILFLCIGYLTLGDAYVLLQMRKDVDGNQSNVDAVIHKKMSGGSFDKLAKQLSRKQLRMASYSAESAERVEGQLNSDPLVFGVNTGAKVSGKKSEGVSEIMELVNSAIKAGSKIFRSKKFEFNDPESTRKKSSVGVEMDTKTLIDSVKKFISSKKFKKTADDVARKAAIIYRAIRDDM